jgi:hypothetical protein
MVTYREFVKEMMPKMMSHPPKERMKKIAEEWKKHKGTRGGMTTGGLVTAAGLDAKEEGGMMSAGSLKKKAPKKKLGVSSSTHSKAIGGFLSALKVSLPEEMKDSNKLSVANAKKLVLHVAKTHGVEFAKDIVGKLKDILDSIKM